LTTYLFTWKPAVFLFVVSILVAAWVLPPHNSFRVEGFPTWYRMISFAVVSVFLICLITRMKTRYRAIGDRFPAQ
jgi:uncharacterized membrane protein YhdT